MLLGSYLQLLDGFSGPWFIELASDPANDQHECDAVIPPEEFNEIADLSDDLAFLKLEAKFRHALNERHQRVEGGEDFDAIRDYLNYTIQAGVELNIPGSDTWVCDLDHGTSRDEYYKQLGDVTQAVDRFRVRTQIAQARKSRAMTRSPSGVRSIGLLDESESLKAESGAFSGSAFDTMAFAPGEVATGEVADAALINLSTSGATSAAGALGAASLTDAHAAMRRQALVVESVLNLWPSDPRVGHNGPPEPIDGADIDPKDLEQIDDLVALLKSQPESVPSPEPLLVEVQSAGMLVSKLKSMGDSFLNKFAESAGTEAGKLISAKSAFLLTLAFNLRDLVDKTLDWIRLLH